LRCLSAARFFDRCRLCSRFGTELRIVWGSSQVRLRSLSLLVSRRFSMLSRSSAVALLTTILFLTTLLTGCGGGATPAAGETPPFTNTPAILSGHLPPTNQWCVGGDCGFRDFLVGLGSNSEAQALNGTGTNNGVPMPSGGTLQRLTVAAGTGSGIAFVYVNGTQTSITCTISAGACSDTTHTATVVAGDVVGIAIAPLDAPTANVRASIEKK
jgi:hypothetical protein